MTMQKNAALNLSSIFLCLVVTGCSAGPTQASRSCGPEFPASAPRGSYLVAGIFSSEGYDDLKLFPSACDPALANLYVDQRALNNLDELSKNEKPSIVNGARFYIVDAEIKKLQDSQGREINLLRSISSVHSYP